MLSNQDNSNLIARTKHLSEQSNTHSHSHHHIIFGLKGHAEFEISGQGGYVQEGVGCIVPSEVSHSFFGNAKNKLLILDLTNNLPLLELESALRSHYLDLILNSPKYFQFDQKMVILINALSNELDIMKNDSSASIAIGQCLLRSLYYRLSGDIEIEEVHQVRDRIDLSRIKRYIYGNLNGKIQSADLARLCNLSESHFYQKFKESVGISPYQYILTERIGSASKMLEDTGKSITEICFTLGFSSQSAFTNAFHQKIGMSPSQYRKTKK
jgi:AraC-like DNA-binding protein